MQSINLKRLTGYCQILTLVWVLNSVTNGIAAVAQDPYDTDPRHLFVRQIKDQFASEIEECRSALKTPFPSVALVSFAKEKLETGRIALSDPDWARMISLLLLGYGYKDGIIEWGERPNTLLAIFKDGYAIACAYLQARGEITLVDASQVFYKKLSAANLSIHVNILNEVVTNMPAETHALVERVLLDKPYLRNYGTFGEFDEFFVDEMTQGLIAGQKSLVAYAIGELPKDKHIPEFLNAFKTLGVDMNGSDKAELINSLARVPVDQYQIFIEASQSLSVGRDPHDQAEIIRAMTKVPGDAYAIVCSSLKQIVPDVDRETPQFVMKLIGSIASIPAQKQTAAFINACKQLSAGKIGEAKLKAIRNYAWDYK